MHMLIILKILSLNGNKKERIERKKGRNKEIEGRSWRKILGPRKENGKLGRGNFKEKKKRKREKRIN